MPEPSPDPSADHGPPPDEPRLAASAEDALLGGPAELSDDTPTIISKNPPRPATSADDVFAGGFRGRRLAHFELIEAIGVGGMAAVLRARDTQLDRCVALKILPPDMALDAENVRRFHQEARSAAKLDHENIARVFFCGEDQRLHFIAFEFVEGENLRTILERRGRLPVGEALHYMLQVAAGLAHASRRGVVHRDIKPSNIIITPNGRAKLVDMGLARSLEPHSDHGLTQSGVTLGTFDYISPEQALEPRDADVRSDIYSLGCTFYHMLTGNAPVPEGTAAKKLHHHQHVKPPDPRQFVPDLPGEVAFILDRMMAKQPKDRYQSPEQLVHHLLVAARKLGAAGDVPEGVLSVEAALPNPPRARPLLFAVLAAAAVVALIFLMDQPSGSPPRPPGKPLADASPNVKPEAPNPKSPGPLRKDNPTSPLEEPVKAPAPVARYDAVRPGADELRRWLKEHKDDKEIEIVLGGDLDLSARDEDNVAQGLVIRNQNQKATIRGRAGRPVTVAFHYDGLYQKVEDTRAPLTIQCKESSVENIRFVVDATEAPGTALAGLLFRGGVRHRVSRCAFVQARPSFNEKKRLSSVVVDASEGGSPALSLDQCWFLGGRDWVVQGEVGKAEKVAAGGQDAVLRRGPARVSAVNCAFGPHAATFRLEGFGPVEADEKRWNLEVTNCSVLAASQSAVFDLAEGADARIRVVRSLISRPDDGSHAVAMGDARGAVLVRQRENPGPSLAYSGLDNRYYNLDSYWPVPGQPDDAPWDDFLKRVARVGGTDNSRELTVAPWGGAEPLKILEKQSVPDAFRPDPRLADLRLKGGLIGVERLGTDDYVASLPPLEPVKPAPGRTLVVGDKNDPVKGIYSMGHALLEVKPGDFVLIRHNGELKIDPVVLNKKDLSDVTIRADNGYHPVLTLMEAAGGEVDRALFQVHDGRLVLENLEFRLRPARDEFEAMAVVSLVGDGQCTLKGCVVTLERAGRKTLLAVASLPDPGKLMKMEPDTPPARPPEQVPKLPRLVFENCFVRGEGDLFWARACRASAVEVRQSLVALTGSLLNVEAAREASAAPGLVDAKLQQVTACVQGPLLRVRAGKDLKGLGTIQCRPEDCLFVPAAPAGDSVLVHLEGPEGEDRALREKVPWESRHNAYGNFNVWLDYQAPEDGKMPTMVKLDNWKSSTNDTSSTYGVRLATPPASDTAFPQVLPSQFRPADDVPAGCGADVTKVPPPHEEDRPRPMTAP
jgi:serine/threonine protein kinase